MLLMWSSWDKVIYNEEKNNLHVVKDEGTVQLSPRPPSPPQGTYTEFNTLPGTRKENHAFALFSPKSSLRLSLHLAQSRFFLGPP
jgi:hypothetical protein